MIFKKINKKIKSIFLWIKNKIKNSPLYWRTLIILLLLALIIKWVIIYFSYENLNPRENVISYLASDIPIIFLSHLLIIINYWIKSRVFRLINDTIVFAVLLLYIIDMFTILTFHSRVALVDIFMLWSSGSSWFDWIIGKWLLIFITVSFFTFFLVQSKTKIFKKSGKNMIVSFSIFTFIYALFYAVILISKIDVNYVKDIISLNIQNFQYDDMELNDAEEINSDDNWYKVEKIRGEWKDLNIILVFAESISAIDSANAGWNNKMPWFDRIQDEWINFTQFITNWTTSDTAHISTLLWVMPLRNIRVGNSPYSGYKLKMKALPDYLNSQWYMTTFISTASLNFLKQRDFLSWAWFQKIIWEEEFTGSEIYTFDSAPDRDLYDRVLQEIQIQTWKYFIGLQTISFHKPYNTPLWKTEDLALRYSDEELFRFYQWLQKIWFFDNWILVIVWDHRKMNAVEEWESERFGPNRYTRAVATVVWSWIVPWTVNSNIIQHTDFYNSLKRLVWNGYVDVDSVYNDIFTQQTNRNRWITNSSVYVENWYTISTLSWDALLFKNLSNLPVNNDPMYGYFSSYASFEFWDEEGVTNPNPMKFIWHRWAIEDSPENTLESFLAAKELWADWIEFDVSYTKDHKNVVVHWETLYASNCKNRKIWNLRLDRIQKNCTIKNWEKYKELQKMLEVIDWLFDYYFLEIKVYDEKLWAEQALDAIQTVKDLNMQDRVIFISYSDAAREVLDSDPDIIYWWDTFDMNDLDFIWENNSKYFLTSYDLLTPEIVQRARDLWKEVVTYTVNETWDFQAMKDLWINIIMSDRIDLLQEYNSTRHYPLPHSVEKLNLKKSSGLIWGFCK